jgi:biotin operon repressor
MEEMSEELIDDFIGMLKLHKLTPEKLHVDIETFGEPTFNINDARVAQKLPVSKKFVAEVPAKSMAIEASGRQAAHLSESLPKNLALKSLTLSPVTFNKPGFQNLTGALGQSRVEELRQGPSTRNTQIRTLQNFMQTIRPTLHKNATLNKFRSQLSNSPETLTDRKLMQSRVAQKITQSMLQAGRDIPDFEQNIAGHINQFLTLQDGFNISRSNQRSYRLAKSPDNYSYQQMDSLRAAYANRRAEQAPAIQAPAAAQAAPAQAEAEDYTTAQRDQKRARLSLYLQ